MQTRKGKSQIVVVPAHVDGIETLNISEMNRNYGREYYPNYYEIPNMF